MFGERLDPACPSVRTSSVVGAKPNCSNEESADFLDEVKGTTKISQSDSKERSGINARLCFHGAMVNDGEEKSVDLDRGIHNGSEMTWA